MTADDLTRLRDRFWMKVDRQGGAGECWLWLANSDQNGYGRFWDANKRRQVCAHRFSYELVVGPIPEGLQIDHLCRVRNCVNPAHLEPVTPRENTMRSHAVTDQNAVKTHCSKGHEFTPENTYVRADGDGRMCRTCTRLRNRALDAQPATCPLCGKAMTKALVRVHRRRGTCNG